MSTGVMNGFHYTEMEIIEILSCEELAEQFTDDPFRKSCLMFSAIAFLTACEFAKRLSVIDEVYLPSKSDFSSFLHYLSCVKLENPVQAAERKLKYNQYSMTEEDIKQLKTEAVLTAQFWENEPFLPAVTIAWNALKALPKVHPVNVAVEHYERISQRSNKEIRACLSQLSEELIDEENIASRLYDSAGHLYIDMKRTKARKLFDLLIDAFITGAGYADDARGYVEKNGYSKDEMEVMDTLYKMLEILAEQKAETDLP